MKKILLYLTLALVALIVIAFVAAPLYLGSVVRAGVNRVGPQMTQSKVELAGASVSPLSGSGTLTGLTVGNPKGWSDQPAFSLGRIHFSVVPSSLFSDTIVINDLTIEQPEFTYETHIVASNIGDLLKNIEAAVGSGRDQAPDKTGKPRKYIVKHFQLQNGRVAVGVGPAALPLPLPALELNDLGVAEGGLTGGQLSFAVMRAVMPNIIAATTGAATKLGGTMGAAAGDAVKRAGEGLQKLLGGKK